MKLRLLCSMLACLLLQTLDAGAQSVKLRATLQAPATNPFFGVSLVRFKEEAERRSQKAISIEIFDRAQLYREDKVVDAVSSGAIEMGITGLGWLVPRIPAASIVEQPFLFNFDALVRAATHPDSEIRRLIDEAILASTGSRVLWWQSLGNTMFYSKGRDVAEPQRIKDQRIRVLGPTLARFTSLCGGRPIVMPAAKMHDALKDGTLDMVMTGAAALELRQLWKVTDTITRTEHASVEFLLIISEKTWQSLSPAHRTVIADAAKAVERETRDRVAELEAKAFAFADAKGMKVLELSPNQVAEWRACSADVLADYMDKNGELARRLMMAYGKLRTDPCCTAGPSSDRPFSRR